MFAIDEWGLAWLLACCLWYGIYDNIIMEFHRHLTRTSANTRSTPKFDTMGGGKEDKLWQTLGREEEE